MIRRILLPAVLAVSTLVSFTSPIQGQQALETKLDTIIEKLDASQSTLNQVAAKVGAEPAAPAAAPADDEGVAKAEIEALQLNINYVWVVLSAALVFMMQAGFAMVELGFSRAKNSINIIMKNFLDFSISTVVFLFLGFGLMFGTSAGGWIGTDSFWLSGHGADDKLWSFWFFQVVFAGTACTIVSGAMAERTKFVGYLVYAGFLSGIIYPLTGHWAWGSFAGGFGAGGEKGWLEALGFVDFAGSSVVHACGGACALAGIIVVGARHGRFGKDGSPRLIAGHNIPLAALGVFILWFGWFGFNGGSTLFANANIGRIVVNTTVAPAAGALAAMISMWFVQGRPDVGITLNGALGGLVGITACCANITPGSAFIVGIIAGLLTTVATIGLERLCIDDAVGAVPVHLVNGWWGTLSVALFDEAGFDAHKFGVQALGTLAISGTAFILCFIIFKVVDMLVGLRASETEQIDGLDFSEHAANAYPDFQTTEQA
ncbi:ammonium transporter [Prosthecobacter debontii]|uniref:Ammonium transporter n=1 Tax=Prosthecobacter debontii TaxID=48467 RepID=A0A1T4YQM6_9BACT|nr:ammonium transporter [Prosthecobacter debontii]SKB03585.1 ammonium transporter [Prosthecobacter debontii]